MKVLVVFFSLFYFNLVFANSTILNYANKDLNEPGFLITEELLLAENNSEQTEDIIQENDSFNNIEVDYSNNEDSSYDLDDIEESITGDTYVCMKTRRFIDVSNCFNNQYYRDNLLMN